MATGAHKNPPFSHLGWMGSRKVTGSGIIVLLASKPIPRDPLPPAKICLLKVPQSPKIVLSARSHVFKHSNMWGTFHLQITTGTLNKQTLNYAQRRRDFYDDRKKEFWMD